MTQIERQAVSDPAPGTHRILLVDLARGIGGVETRVLVMAQALQPLAARCAVATLQGSPLHQRLVAAGVPCEPIRGPISHPRMLWQLRRIIRRGQYQIIDAQNVPAIFWGHGAALLAGVGGLVTTIHGFYSNEQSGLKRRLFSAILRADRVFARELINVTERLQAQAVGQGVGGHSTLIHNVVAVPDTPLSARDPALRAAWGFAPDDFVAAIVARLHPVKGHTYLLQALALLSDQPWIKLVVVGDGPLAAALEQEAAALGIAERVHFAGFCPDVPGILPNVDCVCLASLSEGLPYAVLEAAAHARPILATDVGGLSTLLADDQTALLVPPRDPAALADGLRRLATEPNTARRLGQAAYELIRSRSSIEAMVAGTLAVYDRVQP